MQWSSVREATPGTRVQVELTEKQDTPAVASDRRLLANLCGRDRLPRDPYYNPNLSRTVLFAEP